MNSESLKSRISHFIDQLCWYNVLDKIDFLSRRSTLDGREVLIFESYSSIRPEDLVAYVVAFELDKYNDFDLERIHSFVEDLEIKSIPINEFKHELELFSKYCTSLQGFPVGRIDSVCSLFDQKSLGLKSNELPIGWYYGEGEGIQFCALWHDN